MRYLSALPLILACWSPDAYGVRDAASAITTDAPPSPEASADTVSPADHPFAPLDVPAEAAERVNVGTTDGETAEAAVALSDVGNEALADLPVDASDDRFEARASDGMADAHVETEVDVASDLGADAALDVPRDAGSADVAWAPDASATIRTICQTIQNTSPTVCRNCTGTGSEEFCAFCPATGACSPEVRLPDGSRGALTPCPGPLMLHGENRCPIPDGGI